MPRSINRTQFGLGSVIGIEASVFHNLPRTRLYETCPFDFKGCFSMALLVGVGLGIPNPNYWKVPANKMREQNLVQRLGFGLIPWG